MTGHPDESLLRFRELLTQALAARRGGDLEAPFTIAEIYQQYVPYRSCRQALGVQMNADYEHLLLRMLAGEGGILELLSAPALRAISEELRSVNPDTTVYRDHAAADVRLASPPAMRTVVPPSSGTPAVEGPGRIDIAPGPTPAPSERVPVLPPAPPPHAPTPSAPTRSAPRPPASPPPELSDRTPMPAYAPPTPQAVPPRSPIPPEVAAPPSAASATARTSGPVPPQPRGGSARPPSMERMGSSGNPPTGASDGGGAERSASAEIPRLQKELARLRDENDRLRRVVTDQLLELLRLRERLGEDR